MKYKKKAVISSRVNSKWLAALDKTEASPPALAHEWADQGDVGLFVNPETRGPQIPVVGQHFVDPETVMAAQVIVQSIAGFMLFVAGIAVGKLL